jgi:hypothetical protein
VFIRNFNRSTFRATLGRKTFIEMFKVALFTLLFVASVAARLGGWKAADPKAVEVVQAITFAIHTKYPELSVADIIASKYKVIDAKQQVCVLLCIYL